MKYAVIQNGGKQYLVQEGEVMELDRFKSPETEMVELGHVLLLREGESVHVGVPYVAGAKVTARVLEHKKGEKIRVSKFKAKVRYRKSMGFRPYLTKVQVEKIELSVSKEKDVAEQPERKQKRASSNR